MIAALRALGLGVDQQPESISITPRPMNGPAAIDVGNAGTVMRFLPPLAALATGAISFDGDPRSHERPLKPVIKALEELGIDIDHGGRYALPLTINGSGEIAGGEINIDASQSSQFLSSLLLVAPRNWLDHHPCRSKSALDATYRDDHRYVERAWSEGK